MAQLPLHDAFERGKYMESLALAWKLDSNFKYAAVRNPGLGLDLRAIVFKACLEAVRKSVGSKPGERQLAEQWVESLLSRQVPDSLWDHADIGECNEAWCQEHWRQMTLAHLLCARAAITAPSGADVPPELLAGVNQELEHRCGRTLPLAFVADLTGQLRNGERDRRPSSTCTEAWFPMVAPGSQPGLVAKFVLEPLPGNGEVFVAPKQAFVPMDDAFLGVFTDALGILRQLGLCSPSTDVCIWVEYTSDVGLISTPLVGNSCGGAMALGLWSTWSGKPLRDDVVTSFALRPASSSPPASLCHPVLYDEAKLRGIADQARRSGRGAMFLIAKGQEAQFNPVGVKVKTADNLREAIREAAPETSPSSEIQRRIRAATALDREGQHAEAVKARMDALALAREHKDVEAQVELLAALTLMSSDRRGRGERDDFLREAEGLVETVSSSVVKVLYLRARAGVLERRRESAGAEGAYKEALRICRTAMDDEKGNLAVQGGIVRTSYIHFLLEHKRLDEARHLWVECEDYVRRNQMAADGGLFQAAAMAGIHLCVAAGDEDASIVRTTELEQFASTSQLANRIAGDLVVVANGASHQKLHRLALAAAEAAIRLGRRYDSDSWSLRFLVGALYTEAMVIMQAGDLEKALLKAEAILGLCNSPDDASIRHATQLLIGEICRHTGNSQKAVELFQGVLNAATGGPEDIAFIKLAVARALHDNGQTEDAWKQAQEAWALADSAEIPAMGAVEMLSQAANYGSQIGKDVTGVVARISQLPNEPDELKAEKARAIARVSANKQLRERFARVFKETDPGKEAGMVTFSSLPEANAAVVRPLMRLWKGFPEAVGGLYDFWGRGNFSRMMLNARRFPNSFNIVLEVRSLDDVKRAIHLWGLYADFLILLWKGPVQSGRTIIPVPSDYREPGGWGYAIAAGSRISPKGSKEIWYPAMGQVSMFPDEVAAYLAMEARPFLELGRLIVVPAVAAGCVSPGHGPFEQLLAEAANAVPTVRSKGLVGTPIGLIPHSPNAPLNLLAELADTEASRLRKLRLLLLKRSRELTPSSSVDLGAKELSLEIDDALRDFEDRSDAFARKKGLDKAKEPLAGRTTNFLTSGRKLVGDVPDSPFAPFFVLQSLGYGWRVDGPGKPELSHRFEPEEKDVIGTWLAPPSAGWAYAGVRKTQPQPSKTVTTTKKPGRNDPCPCGSGRKYKKCCGA